MSQNSSSSLTRNDLIGLIWGAVVVLILGMSAIVGFSGLSESVSFSDLLPMFAVALISASVATGMLTRTSETADTRRVRLEAEAADKAKNDQLSLSALNLLSDEDLEDLRAEVKQHLRERLLSGQDGELGSLDALLAERSQGRQR